MNWRVLAPTALQYAFVCGSCWLLVSGQLSENSFLWILLIFGLGRVLWRRFQKSKDTQAPEE